MEAHVPCCRPCITALFLIIAHWSGRQAERCNYQSLIFTTTVSLLIPAVRKYVLSYKAGDLHAVIIGQLRHVGKNLGSTLAPGTEENDVVHGVLHNDVSHMFIWSGDDLLKRAFREFANLDNRELGT